jgi:phosphatidate cytidylyltransferase
VRTRVLSAIVFAAVVLTALSVGGPVWAALIASAAVIGAHEVYRLAQAGGRRPSIALGMLLAAALVLIGMWPDLPLTAPLIACGVLASLVLQIARPAEARSVEDWVWTLAGWLYPASLLVYLVLLRALPEGRGLAWTALLLALIWANDSAAYLGGRAFGRRPFFPTLSPKKTLEGALTGLVASVAIGLVAPAIAGAIGGPLAPLAALSPMVLAAVGLAVGIVGPAGDLSESFLKRQMGVKDSGDLIPGHGGVLDRVDSVIFAAPVVYYFALWLG